MTANDVTAYLNGNNTLRKALAEEKADNAALRRIIAYIIARDGAIAVPREVISGDDAPEIYPSGVNMDGDVIINAGVNITARAR